jgi:hypothetical protein
MTHLRLGLAFLGFALALLSIAFDSHEFAWGAIGVLAASFLLRLIGRRRSKGQDDPGTGL